MSQNRSRRGRPKKKESVAGKGGGASAGTSGGKGGGKGKNRSRGKRRSRPPALDAQRPFWANDEAETEVRAVIGQVRPAQDPTALVRSLGPPPLGRFADNAHHFYAAVYDKAQHFAVAMATANGVLVDAGEDAGDRDGDGAAAEVGESVERS